MRLIRGRSPSSIPERLVNQGVDGPVKEVNFDSGCFGSDAVALSEDFWELEQLPAPIVGGFAVYQNQFTFGCRDTGNGLVQRVQGFPATRKPLRVRLTDGSSGGDTELVLRKR
jgi:hypothetical protein